MSKNLIILICVGESTWAEFSLNLALSIRAADPKQKIGLLYQESTIKHLQPLFDKYFDEGRCIDPKGMKGHELAFYLKTRLYDLAIEMAPDYDGYLFIDSDCILLPNPNNAVDRWFEKLGDVDFTMYCNDVYDIKTKTRKRKDYTWWCEPEEAVNAYELTDKLPQVNSSFIYFKKVGLASMVFDAAKLVYDSPKIDFKDYKNAAPDEFAFNIACAQLHIYPHQTHFRPIWFQFASEIHNTEYIMHYYRAFGFAGVNKALDYVIHFYNNISNYYREHFGIVPRFSIEKSMLATKDPNPIVLIPTAKKTLYRRGEVENSDGGIFNPDQIQLGNGEIMTIARKERDMGAYGNYSHGTALPHVTYEGGDLVKNENIELKPVCYLEKRIEDFRLFRWMDFIVCNHKLVINGKQGERDMKTCLGHIHNDILKMNSIPELPIKLQKCDINWMFFSEGQRLFCVYQLNPYQLFYLDYNEGKWHEQEVKQPISNWWHKNQFICNSTNPILVHGYYFMMFHTREGGYYHHGAVLLYKDTKEIAYYTKNSIIIKDVSMLEGWNKTILYVSGAIYFEETDTLRILAGEGDAHSIYHEYNATEFIQAIKDSYTYGGEEDIVVNNQKALEVLKKI